jgi:hypothetical protein
MFNSAGTTSGQANGVHTTVLDDWLNYVNAEKPTLNTPNPNYLVSQYGCAVTAA